MRNISPTRAGGEIGKNFLQAKTFDNTVITPYFAGVCVCVCLGSETTNPLTSNHMSILAKNQSLLSALQKNLSSPNLPASIKSLAARVLAAPLGRTQGRMDYVYFS